LKILILTTSTDHHLFFVNKLFKKKIGINLKHYSYPEGQKKDFNIAIKKYLKKRGIKICPAAISGFNNIKSDLFNLKRISINV